MSLYASASPLTDASIALQEAPLEVQKKANCIIGKDYPAPIVDHKEIHKINIGRMKDAYDSNKAGKTPTKSKATSGEKPSAKKQRA